MNKLTNLLFATILLFGGCVNQHVPNEFVSIECPKGDISLTLNKDQTFLLELKYWDPQTNSHTHSENMKGHWNFDGDTLILSGSVESKYKRDKMTLSIGPKSTTINGLKWLSSTPSNFADGFDLVDREATDKFFLGGNK